MSEDEVESFEITDYDLENEFNISRPRRKRTKNQQMLGIVLMYLYSFIKFENSTQQ